ncbi:MAG TPA: hypothetical protein VNT50_04820 [Microbacterium sp.]|uniref:PH-like domain-containing protein n=1 Tax=Microbacterium sp. TaxID=51671 RepID=UPI002B6630C0|nr:hypothetical protein [Microbacterium sp.]HWI30789.1 hypothetical protein [Microbacterium sp.]
MTREAAVAVMIGAALLILLAMWWGWSRRRRRDAGLQAPLGDIPAGAETLATAHGFYVATTAHDKPLDRLGIHPLTFRSRVTVTVTTAGVALDIPGAPRVFLAADRLRATGRATWTIDRVVEDGGLPFIAWAVADDVIADSYFRVQDADPADVLDAVARILPQPETPPRPETTPTGQQS